VVSGRGAAYVPNSGKLHRAALPSNSSVVRDHGVASRARHICEPPIDHSKWDALLKNYVNAQALVDYSKSGRDR